MRWIIVIAGSLIALLGVTASIGYFLPVAHEASRSADFNQPPEAVFALIADTANYRTWWDGADVRSEIVERVPHTKLVTRIAGETQFGGTWTFDVAPTPSGSRLTITERGEIYNPIFRTLSKFVFGYTSTMESYLAAASKKLS
ncbi:MAG TPA: hypothetical protein VEC39_18540 [Vicinamibacterales bacterium]|nr:hypothetical protein [Vicinamibacterales bacterium]